MRDVGKYVEGCDLCQRMKNRIVRHSSHQGRSLQNVLRDEWTCGTTLASAYVLRCLSATWSQLQIKERSPSGGEC